MINTSSNQAWRRARSYHTTGTLPGLLRVELGSRFSDEREGLNRGSAREAPEFVDEVLGGGATPTEPVLEKY